MIVGASMLLWPQRALPAVRPTTAWSRPVCLPARGVETSRPLFRQTGSTGSEATA